MAADPLEAALLPGVLLSLLLLMQSLLKAKWRTDEWENFAEGMFTGLLGGFSIGIQAEFITKNVTKELAGEVNELVEETSKETAGLAAKDATLDITAFLGNNSNVLKSILQVYLIQEK
ncbi:MAG: hypothetical protein LBS81_00310 [Endomicrobium sp.]|nr:hypothetical protein [Endomicrobium sp.]